jgi:hypothetical protein
MVTGFTLFRPLSRQSEFAAKRPSADSADGFTVLLMPAIDKHPKPKYTYTYKHNTLWSRKYKPIFYPILKPKASILSLKD